MTEKVKLWRKNNPKKHAAQKRRYRLKNKYGISEDVYEDMFQEQSGKCKICRKPSVKKLHIDHCHETGDVRGLLCSPCNLAIGLFKDDPLTVKSAFEYLNGGAL